MTKEIKLHIIIGSTRDGRSGDKTYGKELPEYLGLKRILIPAGRSSQATLLGKNQQTIESLYISNKLFKQLGSELPRLFPN